MVKISLAVENSIAIIMFMITIVFLALLAIIIQYLQTAEGFERLFYSQQLIDIVLLLWPIFFLERIGYLILCPRRTWKSYFFWLVISLLPPLRLATRRCDNPEYIWLFGWQLVNQSLYERLEKRFLLPILIVSLLMIPFWLTEIFLPQQISASPFLYHLLNLGNALIWNAFVLEFIIMFSITKHRFEYLAKHWLELFIIILPMFALARSVSLLKASGLFKFLKLQKMLNIYRARSVLNRTLRILVAIDIVRRFYQRNQPDQYKIMLKHQLAKKEQELDRLKKQLNDIELPNKNNETK